MTILIVLIGLLISHFATGFRHLRDFRWLMWLIERARRQFPGIPWLAFVLVLVVSLLLSALLIWLMTALLGLVGWVLVALAVFIYTLGPRDLDKDVKILVERDQAESPQRVVATARAMQLNLNDGPVESAAAVFHAALSRWFGILFWFVVLGIPGALIYRLTRIALQSEVLGRDEIEWLARLRVVLDWPVLVLVVTSAALCGDLDRIYRAWRDHPEDQPRWLLTSSTLDRIAAVIVADQHSFDEGLSTGHQMVWRMLVLWLVALSVMLLAGWLA